MITELLTFINWTVQHPLQFFIALTIFYAVLAPNQQRLVRHKTTWPLFAVFIVLDWWMDKLMIFLFADLPKSWNQVVTKRMKLYKKTYSTRADLSMLETWRYKFALNLCRALNVFDENHC